MRGIRQASSERLQSCNQDIGEGGEMKIRVLILQDHHDFVAGTEEELIPAVAYYLLGKNVAYFL